MMLSEEAWHPGQKYTCSQYKKALNSVFDSLWFPSATVRFNVFGSYKVNLKSMVLYAIENGIDEIEYIKSLYDILNDGKNCFGLNRKQR